MLSIIFNVVLPVLIIAGIGFAWAHAKRPFDPEGVSRLIISLGAPSLVFSSLTRTSLDASVAHTAIAAGVLVLVFAAVGALALRVLRLPVARHLPTIVFPNAGNLGLPLCLFALGDDDLAYIVVLYAIMAVSMHALTPLIAAGRMSIRPILSSPAIWVLPPALAISILGIDTPVWLNRTTSMLADLVVPLMLVLLGVSLRRLSIVALRQSVIIGMLRLVLGVGLSWLVGRAFGLQGEAMAAFVLMGSMPPALFAHVYAQRYGGARAGEAVAGSVVVGTFIGLFLLPFIVWFALHAA